jgi:poly-gamma-glutamate synthesis protein (capsule biosynthesis protein)
MRRFVLLCVIFLSACSAGGDAAPTLFVPTAMPQSGDPVIPSPQPTEPNVTPEVVSFYVQPGVPSSLAETVSATLTQAGFVRVDAAEGAALRVVLNPGADAALTAQWVYALVTPFPTIPDDIMWTEIGAYWRGEVASLGSFPTPPQWVVTEETLTLLTALLGAPGTTVAVQIAAPEQLVDTAWAARPAISVVPFDQLEPRWKVLQIDGMNPLVKSMDPSVYPLVAPIGVIADGPAGMQAVGLLQQGGTWVASNRDPAKVDTIVMSGVTALSRAVAKSMETYSMTYPADQIMPFIADADILHTSNEASFDPDCPVQDWYGDPLFCEHRRYYELFRHIGLDIVELTGNHNLDYGVGPALNSLDVYDAEGLPYFGGGRNLEDATTPRILTGPSGARYAFLGCNMAGPFGAWATNDSPGAAPCEDWTRIRQQIDDLKASGQAEAVIVTVQYQERDAYDPTDQQRVDFEALSTAGADIVSGSQAHQPQGFSFVNGRIVHFGVGNTFFDQIDLVGNRQMFLDKHIFYEGRHIGTILYTGYFEDVAQARPMTPDERAAFLEQLFAASGW